MADNRDALRVFISYARRDASAFAEELLSGLEVAGFQAFLDRHDIAAGEDWEARLGGLIESADTVVFVVTPAAVASERCKWEVERAEALSKRVIPVVFLDVPEAETPHGLKRLNYIFFTEGQSYSRALGDLAKALRVDLDWIREHTRLGELARRWRDRDRSDVLLLRGPELEVARAWMSGWRAPAPEPTDLHREFIAASDTAEGLVLKEERERLKRQGRLQRFAAYATAAAFGVTLLGAWAVIDGRRALGRSQSLVLANVAQARFEAGDYVRGMRLALLSAQGSLFSDIARDEATAALIANASASQLLMEFRVPFGEQNLTFLSDDGSRVAIWSGDTVRVWDTTTGGQVGNAMTHRQGSSTLAQFSPDNRRLLTCGDEGAVVWDIAAGAALGRPITGSCRDLTRDGSHLLVDSNGETQLWDVATGARVGQPLPLRINESLHLSDNGRRILTWNGGGMFRQLDATSGAQIGPELGVSTQGVAGPFGAFYSPDLSRILSWGLDGAVRQWDAVTGVQIGPLMQHSGQLFGAVYSGDGSRILAWDGVGDVRLWNAVNGEQIGENYHHDNWAMGATFNRAETRILTWSEDGTAGLWDIATGEALGEDATHSAGIWRAQLSPDESMYVTYSKDETARVWNAETGQPLSEPMRCDEDMRDARFTPDGTRVVVRCENGWVRVWRATAESGNRIVLPIESPPAGTFIMPGAVYSGDGSRVLTWWDRGAQIVNATDGARVGAPIIHDDQERILSAIWSPDESRVLTWTDNRGVRQWDATTGAPIGGVLGPRGGHDPQYSRDMRRVLVSAYDDVHVLDAQTGAQIGRPMPSEFGGGALMSADGQRVLIWGRTGARLWNADTGAQIGAAMEHGEKVVTGALFAADETRIVTWSTYGEDEAARLWNAADSAPIGRPMQHEKLQGAAVSDDGRRLITWGGPTGVRQWDIETTEQIGPDLRYDGGNWATRALYFDDGRRILSWSRHGNAVRQWNAATGAQIGADMRHQSGANGYNPTVDSAAISPDGTRILSWSDDGVRIWSAATGAPLTPPIRQVNLEGAALSPDGRHALTWTNSFENAPGAVIIWDIGSTAPRRSIAALRREVCAIMPTSPGVDSAGARQNNFRWPWQTAARVNYPSVRRIDSGDVALAPILRGREGEDVCAN